MKFENETKNEKRKNGGFTMIKNMRKQLKNEKGLTLVELLAVIVILAIIAAIAIPAIGNIIDSSRVKAAKADAANVYNAANIYFAENSDKTTFTNETEDQEEFISELGSIETFTVNKEEKTVETTGKSGGKSYSISTTTLENLKIDSGKAEEPFSWGE